MFETLQDRLGGIFDKLTGRGALSEADVDTAMREVRRALIEALLEPAIAQGTSGLVKAVVIGRLFQIMLISQLSQEIAAVLDP